MVVVKRVASCRSLHLPIIKLLEKCRIVLQMENSGSLASHSHAYFSSNYEYLYSCGSRVIKSTWPAEEATLLQEVNCMKMHAV